MTGQSGTGILKNKDKNKNEGANTAPCHCGGVYVAGAAYKKEGSKEC